MLLASEFPPGPGGIGTHAYELARGLRGLGWEPTVLAPQHYARAEEVAEFNRTCGFPVVSLRSARLKPLTAFARARAVTRALGSTRPDLLVATGARAAWIAAAVGRRPLPWAAIGHGSEFALPGRWERALTRMAFNRAAVIVCVSRFTSDLMRRAGIRAAQECVIPNGADPGRFTVLPAAEVASFRARLGLDSGPLILTVGNVSERKGQDVVIRALPEILRRHPGTRYAMAGLPTRRAELTRLAEGLGVAGQVHFLGRLDSDDLVGAYNACDVFAMTSRTTAAGDCEGYGIAAVEAALCGKPAVVSRGSGLVEAISDGRTGVAVSEDDPVATAAALVGLLDDPARRAEFGRAARRRALAEQTWERRVREYDTLFRTLARSPADRAGQPRQVAPSCNC
jgi:phosphatidylinositol alpha-1,6-mannosyltransferase